MHQAEFHPLSCQAAAEGEQHWNCQAVSLGARLGALKGSLYSVCSHGASKMLCQEFSHLLTKSEHTVMLKYWGINKQ